MADLVPETDPAKLPTLGRWMMWVEKPGAPNIMFYGLAIACAVVFLADFTYEKHEKVETANTFGFYGVYGFLAFAFIIFAAKTLRMIIKRPENFYGDQDINAEETPEHMLERINHDGL